MRNWRINLAAAWVAQFLCMSGFAAAIPFFPFYIRELGVTDPDQVKLWAGALVSGGAVSMALVSPLWGVLADRKGRKLMVQRATFGGALVLAAMAFVGNVQQLFVMRMIQGTLTGTVPAFMALVAGFAPAAEAGMALGLMQMAVYMGASVGPLIGGVVADHFGYRWTFALTGSLLLVAGLLVHFLIKERFEPPKEKNGARDSIAASADAIVHSMPVLAAIVTLGAFYTGNFTARPMLPLYVETLLREPGMVNTRTGTIYGVGAVSSAIAAVAIGRLSDRIGCRAVLIGCSLGAMAGFLAQALSGAYEALLGASFTTGFFMGGLLPAANAIVARDAPPEQRGAIYGLSNSVNADSRALGPMLGAAMATAWGLRAPFLASAGVFGLIAVWVLFAVKGGTSVQPSEVSETSEG